MQKRISVDISGLLDVCRRFRRDQHWQERRTEGKGTRVGTSGCLEKVM